MLILTRKLDESIIIDEDTEIKIVDIRENTVKVGISAPKSVKIFRKEVYEEIKRENILAADSIAKNRPENLEGLLPPSILPDHS